MTLAESAPAAAFPSAAQGVAVPISGGPIAVPSDGCGVGSQVSVAGIAELTSTSPVALVNPYNNVQNHFTNVPLADQALAPAMDLLDFEFQSAFSSELKPRSPEMGLWLPRL